MCALGQYKNVPTESMTIPSTKRADTDSQILIRTIVHSGNSTTLGTIRGLQLALVDPVLVLLLHGVPHFAGGEVLLLDELRKPSEVQLRVRVLVQHAAETGHR